jgi:hypothetical protein
MSAMIRVSLKLCVKVVKKIREKAQTHIKQLGEQLLSDTGIKELAKRKGICY